MNGSTNRVGRLLLILGTLAILLYVVMHFATPVSQKFNGIHLQYRTAPEGSTYLVGTHSQSKSWAYRNGQMLTPLGPTELDEIGTVVLDNDAASQPEKRIRVKAKEWIKMLKNGETTVNQTIPISHPSIAPSTIVLDSQGRLMERQNTDSVRVGRAAGFLFPAFPKGKQPLGHRWQEPVSWNDSIGDWIIHWQGSLSWILVDKEACYKSSCAKLTYEATLTPSIVKAPGWANGLVQEAAFEGRGSGEALFDLSDQALISNTLNCSGRLTISLKSLETVPDEQQVGAPLSNEPGNLVIDFSEKLDVRKPT